MLVVCLFTVTTAIMRVSEKEKKLSQNIFMQKKMLVVVFAQQRDENWDEGEEKNMIVCKINWKA